MKNKITGIITFLIFILITVSCKSPEKKVKSLTDTFTGIKQEVEKNSIAYSSLKEATDIIGHRLTGTENGRKAEEYTYNKFKEFGFEDVKYQEFEVEAWMRDDVSLTISGVVDSLKGPPVVSLGHSPVKADVEAEIIDMGNGLEMDYADSVDIDGKIALVYIGILEGSEKGLKNLHRSEKTALAIEHGAEGILIINQVDGGVLLTGTASVTGSLLPIPAVCIGKEDGMALKKALKSNTLSARIVMSNFSKQIKARNVIATLKGSELPEEKIIVGGHLDSWDLATGAIDNGIGSFAVLDMARSFMANELQPRRTVQFIMFMGEEQGLLGSTYMVEKMKESGEIENVKYMMNIDMTGNPIGFNPAGRGEAEEFFKDLGKKIQDVDSLFKNTFRNRAGLHSDHQPFMLEGTPIIFMNSNLDRSVYRCYHSDCDDFDLVNKDHITNTVKFGTMALYGLANAEKLPAGRMTDEQTRQFMIEQGLKDKLVLGNDWKWSE